MSLQIKQRLQQLCIERGCPLEDLMQEVQGEVSQFEDPEAPLLDLLDRCVQRMGIEFMDVFNIPRLVSSRPRSQLIEATRYLSDDQLNQSLVLAQTLGSQVHSV